VAIAGSHVTNDVAVALCTPPKSAEKIKVEYGHIMTDVQSQSELIEVEALANQATKKVSKQLLSEVLEARYREIFAYVKRDLTKAGLLGQIPGGIVLTGGAANMPGIEALAGKVFACPVRLAQSNLPLKEDVESDAGYALSLGLVLQAMQKHDKLDVSRTGAMRRMWKQFQYWLDYHL
jgi:cell division protein FtsA